MTRPTLKFAEHTRRLRLLSEDQVERLALGLAKVGTRRGEAFTEDELHTLVRWCNGGQDQSRLVHMVLLRLVVEGRVLLDLNRRYSSLQFWARARYAA
jgi:hypothetical protein